MRNDFESEAITKTVGTVNVCQEWKDVFPFLPILSVELLDHPPESQHPNGYLPVHF